MPNFHSKISHFLSNFFSLIYFFQEYIFPMGEEGKEDSGDEPQKVAIENLPVQQVSINLWPTLRCALIYLLDILPAPYYGTDAFRMWTRILCLEKLYSLFLHERKSTHRQFCTSVCVHYYLVLRYLLSVGHIFRSTWLNLRWSKNFSRSWKICRV